MQAFKTMAGFAMMVLLATIPLASDRAGPSAGQGSWNFEDPTAKFDTRKNLVNKSTITWMTTDTLQATCEAESRKRGNNGFGYAIEACSFWVGNTCTIITPKKTTLQVLGHETLHCFQGSFH